MGDDCTGTKEVLLVDAEGYASVTLRDGVLLVILSPDECDAYMERLLAAGYAVGLNDTGELVLRVVIGQLPTYRSGDRYVSSETWRCVGAAVAGDRAPKKK